MADPILPDHYRLQVVFQHQSQLAKDRFVNSFVFVDQGAPGSETDKIEMAGELVYDFFFTQAPSWRVSSYLSNRIQSVEIRGYRLGQAPPRQPYVMPVTLPSSAFSTANPMPEEVAIVCSLYTSFRSPRGRGRLFLGPLTVNALAATTAGPRVPNDTMQTVAAAAERLRTNETGMTWSILSLMDGAARPVRGGWVDNAFDTMRKRGREPTHREEWGEQLWTSGASIPRAG